MREDFKYGILLGFLLVVGVFVYWLIHREGDLRDLTGRNEPAAAPAAPAATPPGPMIAAGGTATTGTTGAAAQEPRPAIIPPRTLPSSVSVPVEPTPALESAPPPITTVPPVVPPTVDSARVTPTTVAPGSSDGTAVPGTTAEFAKLQKAPNGSGLYSTQAGDSPWAIAVKFYGKGGPTQIKTLTDANAGVSFDPLPSGVKILIPVPPATAEAAPPVAPTAASANDYVVKEGDTLSKIASEKLGSANLWRKILEVNPDIDEKHLPVGKVIKLPPKDGLVGAVRSPDGAPPVRPGEPVLGPNEYLVKSGDTLSSIAREKLGHEKYYELIVKANPGIDPNRLQVGQKIKLPPKPDAAATPAGSPPAAPPAGTESPSGEPGFRI